MNHGAETALLVAKIRAMSDRGESAYGLVDGQEVVDIPARACAGRAGTLGKTFSGYLNLRTGKMRFDCAEELPFYLEVDLSKVPAFDAQPSGPAGDAAVRRAEKLARHKA